MENPGQTPLTWVFLLHGGGKRAALKGARRGCVSGGGQGVAACAASVQRGGHGGAWAVAVRCERCCGHLTMQRLSHQVSDLING